MERKQYIDQIKELVLTVQMLLDANIALGNKQKEQKEESDRKIADLQAQVDKLTGELQANGNGSTGFLQGILWHDCSWKKELCLDDKGTFS